MKTVTFDDAEIHVDDRVHDIYMKHIEVMKSRLATVMDAEGLKDGLKGPVYQPLPQTDPNLFSVAIKTDITVLPGRARLALRQTFEKELPTRDLKDEKEYLGFIFGGYWRRYLISQSEIVRWMEREGHKYKWGYSLTDSFRPEEQAISTRIRLTWVDRGGIPTFTR